VLFYLKIGNNVQIIKYLCVLFFVNLFRKT